MQRSHRQLVLGESTGYRLHIFLDRVIEMASRAENLDGLETGFGNLPEKFRGQFSRHKQVSG
jgi:hypothetical protein